MPAFLLIFFYCAIVYLIILRHPFFKIKQIGRHSLTLIFFIKLMIGFLYGYIHQVYFEGGDTFLYFTDSQRIADTFFQYPSYYWQSLTWQNPDIPANADVFIYPDSKFIIKDLGSYVLVHLHALFLLFCGGSYQVHLVFIAFIGLCASLNFYKVFASKFSIDARILMMVCFFTPSVLFWTAGFHKDLWIYYGFSLLVLGLSQLLKKRLASSLCLLTGLIILGVFRYYLLFLVFPAILAYLWASIGYSARPFLKFSIVYAFSFLGLVLVESFSSVSLLEMLVQRQSEFLAEHGGSNIANVQALSPSFSSFFSFLPEAITNASLRPFLWNCKDFLQFLAALEIAFFWIFVLLSLRFKSKHRQPNPLSYFLLFYAISNILLIGYLVANIGTIVRYRSIALGFIAIIVVQAIDWVRWGILTKQSSTSLSKTKVAKPNISEIKEPYELY